MKEVWTNRWKKLLIWVSGYLGIIPFVIVGGYTIVKSNDEELKKTTHRAFVVTIIFTIIAAFIAIYTVCMDLADNVSYKAEEAIKWISGLTVIAEFIVYAIFAIVDFCKKDDKVEVIKETDDKED